LAVALAGPREVDANVRVKREGIAIMMAIDVSSSMLALDLSDEHNERHRLDAVKSAFVRFIKGDDAADGDDAKLGGRPDDAIGVVSFGRYADSTAPLTFNHLSVIDIVKRLQPVRPNSDDDGTAIGDGLDLAVARILESDAKSKVVILLSDGANNTGDTQPLDAAQFAADNGIKIYTIGAGRNGIVPIRTVDPVSGEKGPIQRARSQVDEDTLKQIAEKTEGRFFRVTDPGGIEEVYEAIDKLEKTELEERRLRRYIEHFEIPIVIALILAAVGWLMGATIFRRLP